MHSTLALVIALNLALESLALADSAGDSHVVPKPVPEAWSSVELRTYADLGALRLAAMNDYTSGLDALTYGAGVYWQL